MITLFYRVYTSIISSVAANPVSSDTVNVSTAPDDISKTT
jgi:hypothetical protein